MRGRQRGCADLLLDFNYSNSNPPCGLPIRPRVLGSTMCGKETSSILHLRRYAGCRIFDPGSRAYLSAEDLERLVRRGVRVSIREVETGQDVTDEVVQPNLQ